MATIVVDVARDGGPACPRHLSPAERKIWIVAARELRQDRRLMASHGPLLERFAVLVERSRKVDEVLEADGYMLDGKAHPLLPISVTMASKIREISRELGMTPAARLPTINPEALKPVEPDSPIAMLLKRRA